MAELYVFGSATSGDVDSGSDLDVLVVVDPEEDRSRYPASWSIYSRLQIESLFRRGTLFAWHLYLDGVRIFPRAGLGFLSRLGEPAPYVNAEAEIAALTELGSAAVEELRGGTPSTVFELGILYLVSRDVAMAASCSILGHFSFSRLVPFSYEGIPIPLRPDEYCYGMECRRSSTRGRPLDRDLATESRLVEKAPALLAWWQAIHSEVGTCKAS